jgi:acyl-CoA reductase-like NAD-dependent aldehyde dehydrogenase
MFIGGQWTAPHSRQRITVVSPASEEPIGSVPEADRADVDAAVSAARAAFDDPHGWTHWDAARRASAIQRFADELESRSARIAHLVSSQNGMPINMASAAEGTVPATLLRYYAEMVAVSSPDEMRASSRGGETLVRREPMGVVGAIAPFNYPQALAAYKYAPALAAGCTVVLKPSPETVLDTEPLAEAAAEAGLPAGVFNIVPGGREAGAMLVEHPAVDKIGFTGSTAAGRSIAEACGRRLRPVTLELGGKSAAIILDDADLDLAAIGSQLFAATLVNSGQTCHLSTRILAPRERYEEVTGMIEAMARSLVIGDPLDPSTQVGPLVSAQQRARVEGLIARGRDDGARLVTGGGRPRHLTRGWFVEPTVFADVDNRSVIAQEEIFGPVLVIIPYRGDEEAIRIANDSPYGLGGSVWTRDARRGIEVAKRVHTGSLRLNGAPSNHAAPFGGVKASGIGTELGPEGLAQYQHLKSIFMS